MPKDSPTVAARRLRLREWIETRFGSGPGAQEAMIEEAKKRGHSINQGMLSALLKDKSFGERAAANLEKKANMPDGYLVRPLPEKSGTGATPIFTKEQRASGDVVALQLGMQALVKTVLNRLPGTAEPFLYLLTSAANELAFSTDAGLLASLVGIADEALSAEEEVNRALQRARSGGRPKPKK